MNFEIGTLVCSKAGHDKGQLFVVVKEDKNNLYLSDGKNKTVEYPKKKNKKHVQIIHKKLDLSQIEKDTVQTKDEVICDFIRYQSE